jgi:hypothetical protein
MSGMRLQSASQRSSPSSSPPGSPRLLPLTSLTSTNRTRSRSPRPVSSTYTRVLPSITVPEGSSKQLNYLASNSEPPSEGDVDEESTEDGEGDEPSPEIQLHVGSRSDRVLVERKQSSSPGFAWASASPNRHSQYPPVHRSHTLHAKDTLSSRRRQSPAPPVSDAPPGSPLAPSFARTSNSGGFRFRSSLLPEVSVLVLALVLAIDRLRPVLSLPSLVGLAGITIITPTVALFRRPGDPKHYLMVPFTDARGYRDALSADDGFAVGVSLPVLLAAGVLWDVARPTGASQRFPNVPALWTETDEAEGRAVLRAARVDLFALMILNSFVLVIDLILARTWLQRDRVTENNTRRFFGAAGMAASVSSAVALCIKLLSYFELGMPRPFAGRVCSLAPGSN